MGNSYTCSIGRVLLNQRNLHNNKKIDVIATQFCTPNTAYIRLDLLAQQCKESGSSLSIMTTYLGKRHFVYDSLNAPVLFSFLLLLVGISVTELFH